MIVAFFFMNDHFINDGRFSVYCITECHLLGHLEGSFLQLPVAFNIQVVRLIHVGFIFK